MSDDDNSVDLSFFRGQHTFAGITVNDFMQYGENATSVSILIDDQIYTFMEDPEDGYRSGLGEVIQDDSVMIENIFENQRVVGEYVDTNSEDYIRLMDVITGKVILVIGTDNMDDYYPYFIFQYNPENMSINSEFNENDDTYVDDDDMAGMHYEI